MPFLTLPSLDKIIPLIREVVRDLSRSCKEFVKTYSLIPLILLVNDHTIRVDFKAHPNPF
jgi:hypothetical protein